MKYAFVLGRVYTLSVAEIISLLAHQEICNEFFGGAVKILEASEELLIIETEADIKFQKIQKILGGVVKILKIIDVLPRRPKDSINFTLKHYFKPGILKSSFFKDYKGKKQFGVSVYLLDLSLLKNPGQSPALARASGQVKMENNIFFEPKRIAMMIKKTLTDLGISIRAVLPENFSLSLSSVSVTKNLILEKGAEICVLAKTDAVYVAVTLVVQDFEDYGRRDYQRPARDDLMGMIPPKVAQMMLNLSGCLPGEAILDPFCGLGTVLQEGSLLGYKMFGSDINRQAIKGCQQNLEWFRNRYKIAPGKFMTEVSDSRNVSKFIQAYNQKIGAIVTECTLGPVYSKFPTNAEIQANFGNLISLYEESFKDFALFLHKGAKIVMCIPAYRKAKNDYIMMENLDFARNLGYNLQTLISPEIQKSFKFLKLTQRGSAIYDRKDQIVAREICIFEKT